MRPSLAARAPQASHLGRRCAALMLVPLVALSVMIAPPASAAPSSAADAPTSLPGLDATAAAGLEAAAVTAMVGQTRLDPAAATAAGRRYQVTPQRFADGWVYGAAILRAAPREGDHPLAWLFIGQRNGTEWTVTLEGSRTFDELATKAPAGLFSDAERTVFAARADSQGAEVRAGGNGNNTGLQLPWQTGTSWIMTSGPHGWSGTDLPYAYLDLVSGGSDKKVRAAGDGTVQIMCTTTQANGRVDGWVRILHSNGYSTDYYHMQNLKVSAGAWVQRNTFIGKVGTNLCAGGSASAKHVHFGLLSGGSRVSLHWKMISQWVFWTGAAYGGYALHGSTQVNPGGSLYNYAPMASTEALVDAWGNGTVNLRTGPGTTYPLAGTLNDGQVVTVACVRNGTSHAGRYGTTAVWNRLPDGRWFSDAYAYTGRVPNGPTC